MKEIIYVGYVLNDYANAVCVGYDRKKVEELLKTWPQSNKWIEEILIDSKTVVEL